MSGAATPGRTGGLLAVHAHPDDETLSTGALLATAAAAGVPVTVVTCTRGERGEVIPADLAHLEGDADALAAVRVRELTAALEALGAGPPVLLDEVRPWSAPDDDPTGPRAAPADAGGGRFTDSGMAWLATGRAGAAPDLPPGAFVAVPVEEAADRLERVLRERRPDVVVGYEPGGGYGHPDHVHAHAVLAAALRRVPELDPVVLWAAVDATVLRAGYRDGATWADEDGLEVPDPDGPLPSAAVDPAEVAVRVPVRPVLGRLLGALRAHATQVTALRVLAEPASGGAVLGSFALSNRLLQPLPAHEVHRHVAGPPPGSVPWLVP